jgi:large conductance mechanosensitive channel
MKNFINEFKSFALKGNVVDLAIGVIIGAAFSKIIDSVVTDIVMPIIGIFIGGVDFTGLVVKFGDSTIKYGNFIQAVFNLCVVAFALLLIIKAINKLKKPVQDVGPVPIPEDIKLLTEIRDSLRK